MVSYLKGNKMRPERVATQRRKRQEYTDRSLARLQPRRPVPEWSWVYAGQSGLVAAWTRSEAKAIIKDVLRTKGRLPKEVALAPRT